MNQPTRPLRISVVTPSFNQGKFIERTLLSILDQGYPNLELIVIDGGSTDETVSILKKYEGRIYWLSEKDNGQSDAINKGLKKTSGDIVCYVNSDDLLLPGALTKVNEYFSQHSDALWVTGYCRTIDQYDREIPSFSTRYKNFLLRHFHPSSLLMINFISQMSTFWRRTAVERVGYFSETNHLTMDYDYWLRLLPLGRPGIIFEDLSCFRLHQDSKSTQRYRAQFRQSYTTAVPYIRTPWLRAASWLHNQLVIMIYSLQARQHKH